jgi:hypothetical protein
LTMWGPDGPVPPITKAFIVISPRKCQVEVLAVPMSRMLIGTIGCGNCMGWGLFNKVTDLLWHNFV